MVISSPSSVEAKSFCHTIACSSGVLVMIPRLSNNKGGGLQCFLGGDLVLGVLHLERS